MSVGIFTCDLSAICRHFTVAGAQVEAPSPIAFPDGAGVIALAAGSAPALRAARLQPVIAMRDG
jgi:ABC-type antimicrobial peptide transport system permease subunit